MTAPCGPPRRQLGDLLGPSVSIEIVQALREEDPTTVVEEALRLLQRVGVALHAESGDVDVLLQARPREGTDRLAEALRRHLVGQSYTQGQESSS
jgi:hypothetical protein